MRGARAAGLAGVVVAARAEATGPLRGQAVADAFLRGDVAAARVVAAE